MKKFVKASKINNHYICVDIESSSRDPYTTQILELAAIVYDCNTLQEKDNGRFSTLVKPTNWSTVEEGALKVNKITLEELETAPEEKFVFEQFIGFCHQFTKNESLWSQLIPCGQNIKAFDLIILELMSRRYKHTDKSGRSKLLHPTHNFDLMDILRLFFHNCNDLPSYSLDNVTQYFGLKPTKDAHRALADVETSWIIIKRFLEFFRKFSPNQITKFKNCFSKDIISG